MTDDRAASSEKEVLTNSQPLRDNFASQDEEEIKMHQEVFADKEFPNDWRVETIDRDSGDIFVAVFSGPDSEPRAREYAEWQESKQRQQLAA
jgi:hypothetical protein